VSAMFTAIQDFVRDSFSASKQEELNSVEVGQYTVWVERGPHAVLACVIRGDAHRTFRNLMREQLETIHARHSIFLEQFDGDNTKLKYCQPLLEELLRSELKPEAQPRWMTPQLAMIVGGILLSILGFAYYHFEYQYRLNNYLEALQHTPGIIVTSTETQHGNLIVHGMRDPLAEDPIEIARRFQFNNEDVQFIGKPYQDLNPQMVEQRLRLWLSPPKTVQMSLQGSLLHLKGHADQAWIDKVSDRVWKLAGVTDIDSHELVNTEAQFQAYLKTLNETPGIMVVSSGVKEGQRFITGMRDPLAEDPAEIAKRMQISDMAGTWRPYQDLTPQFVEKRVLTRLQPPATVITRLEGEVLHFEGHASPEWINNAIESARTVPGVNKLVTDKLITVDQFLQAEAKQQITLPKKVTMTIRDRVLQISGHLDTATFQGLQTQLEKFKKSQPELASIDSLRLTDIENEVQKFKLSIDKTMVFFAEDIALLSKQEEVLQALLKDFQQLLAYNQELKRPTLLQVTGNTDGLGTELYNQELGQRRAEVIVEWLNAHGIDQELLAILPPTKMRFGELEPNPNDRNAVFQVLTKIEKK
jgi:outer membrane protein OmpA-like peptidoglycan-associated protein